MSQFIKRPEVNSKTHNVRKPRDIGDVIKVARERARLNQAELANEVGIDRFYLGRMESGVSNEYLDRLLRILKSLGITMSLTLPDD
jgi:transcriptional regulator with XRE-family HTH domain